jgi:hypothetical protein
MSYKELYSLTYAEKASFANVLCTTSSAAGVIGTSLEPIFDSDHSSVVFSSNVSDDITYTADAGTFTFSRAGIYHIVLAAVTQQETAHRLQTFAMHLNSASAFYTGLKQINTGYDPVESTHQAVVSIAADDVLHIQMKTGGNTATVIQGTSVIITEITSGHYASHQATANGTNTNIDEFNPFDTNYTNNPASYTTVTAGMTVTATDGSFTVNSSGRYFIMVTNLFLLADASGGTSIITMKLKKGGTAFTTRAVTCIAADDPAENTFCLIEDLAAGDVMTATWDTNDATAGDGVRAQKGTTFTIYKLHEQLHINGDTSGFFGYPYISVQSLADSASTVLAVSPFDEDSYSSADFETRSSSGITFTAADGKFTVSEPGLYAVVFTPIFSLSSGGTTVITINVNGVTQVTSTAKVANGPDPLDRTTTAFLDLNKNDYVEVFTDMEAGKPAVIKTGTSISIYRYFGFFKTEDTLASGLIDDDFTINTFSQDNLSVQYERSTEQVLFRLGVRGAPTIRGKNTISSVPKLGDKKN